MDITKELKYFNLNDNYGINVIEDIEKQQKKLMEKMHLFTAISVAHEFEDTVATKFFERNGVYFFKLNFEFEYGMQGYLPNFEALNKSKIKIYEHYSNGQKTKETIFFNSIISKMIGINMNLVNRELKMEEIIFELKPGIGNQILNLFLTKELKAIYDCNKMQNDLENELEQTNKNINKRLKV